jgi:hypothetical protein
MAFLLCSLGLPAVYGIIGRLEMGSERADPYFSLHKDCEAITKPSQFGIRDTRLRDIRLALDAGSVPAYREAR